jgi:hypothetical protein
MPLFHRWTVEGKRKRSGEVQEGILLMLPQACLMWFLLAPLALHLHSHFIERQTPLELINRQSAKQGIN